MSLNRLNEGKKVWEQLTTGRHFVLSTVRRLAAEVAIEIGTCSIRNEYRHFEMIEELLTATT